MSALSDDAQVLLVDMLQGPVRLVTRWETRGVRKMLFRYQRDDDKAPLHVGGALAELGRALLVDPGEGETFVLSEAGKALGELPGPRDGEEG
jgi:hypothetical protein